MSTRPILITGDTRAVLSAFSPEPVSMAALTASQVAIEWHEGVAIVQEACRLLLESSTPASPGELSAGNVKIDLTGAVLVPRGGVQDGPAAVSQLGALLRDLLPDTIPVPLRLAISQAMSSPPHYTSLRSFSEALSYFERPDRTSIIRGVYERWEANAGGRPPAQPRPEPARKSQPPAETPAPEERRTQTAPLRWRRWLLAGGSIALAMALGVAAALWAPRLDRQIIDRLTDSSTPTPDESSDAATATPAAPEAKRPATSGTSVPAAVIASGADAVTPNQRTHPEALVVLQPPAESSSLRSPAAALPVRPASSPSAASVTLEAPRQAPPQPNLAAINAGVSVTLVEPAPGSHIYSALDTDVAAPVAAYPQSPTVATVLHDDEVITFDVIIDETGKVESVKLRRAPSSIRSALMLTMSMSVAKAWRFQPATRHGRSVKYRQSISVPAPQ